ncbi:MAG: zinc ribbon domain-containing protein [Caldicoprobacterales bacterium]|jgi:predicted  nucleic acid-binding Zn-ribbon protein|nr:hypothetical protein [Clostridiales bacterium]
MERLEALWKYQELDLLVDQYNLEKKNSDSRQRLLKIKNYLIKQEQNLVSMDNNADMKLDLLAKLHQEYSNIKDRIQIQLAKLETDEVLSLEELDELTKEGLTLKNNIRKKEEELEKLTQDLKKFQRRLDDIRKRVASAKTEYVEVKKDYDAEVKKINEELLKVKSQRDKIGEEISKPLMAKYKNIKSSKSPVISLLSDNQCDGCFMSLASLVIQRVKDGKKIVECENCGRILYYRESEESIPS